MSIVLGILKIIGVALLVILGLILVITALTQYVYISLEKIDLLC